MDHPRKGIRIIMKGGAGLEWGSNREREGRGKEEGGKRGQRTEYAEGEQKLRPFKGSFGNLQ